MRNAYKILVGKPKGMRSNWKTYTSTGA